MNRRNFIAASGLAAAAPLASIASAKGAYQDAEFYELRQYHLLYGSRQRELHDFMENVAVPAYNRIGIQPVGAFSVVYGQNAPSLYLLLPHSNLDSFVSANARLLEDPEYARAEAVNAALADPAYVRYETQLMRAFDAMPHLETPPQGSGSRLFELRTYESHSIRASKKKVEMFNAGEVPIFRDTGLTPVFFGETLAGTKMPNLTYMLVFEDLAERDAAWQAFIEHPDWITLRDDPQYADTVSAISDIILRPTGYSQI